MTAKVDAGTAIFTSCTIGTTTWNETGSRRAFAIFPKTKKEQLFEQQAHLQSQIIVQLSTQAQGVTTKELLSPPAKIENKLKIEPNNTMVPSPRMSSHGCPC